MSAIGYIFAGFCFGMICGLVFGPDGERENVAKVDGWLEGYAFRGGVDPQIADLVEAVARGETDSQRND